MEFSNVSKAAALAHDLNGVRALLRAIGSNYDFIRLESPRMISATSISHSSDYPGLVHFTPDEMKPALEKAEARLIAELRARGVDL